MTIPEIQHRLQALNGASPAPAKVKRPSAAPALKTNGHTVLNPDELLAISAARIVAAFDLGAKGVTPEALVAGVRKFEQPYVGVVQ
jgi:hypothetical protein